MQKLKLVSVVAIGIGFMTVQNYMVKRRHKRANPLL
jgi:hypothetical protein